MQVLLPYCLSIPDHSFYQNFHLGLTEALHELGHEAVTLSCATLGQSTQEEAAALLHRLASGRVGAVLDLACWGFGLSRTDFLNPENGRQQAMFEAFEVPYMGMLFDHPYNQAINVIRARRAYAVYPDLGHSELLRMSFPGLRLHGEIFSPPGIRPGNDRSAASWSERDIDVLYVGNLAPVALERSWLKPLPDGQRRHPFQPVVTNAIVNAALAHPERSLHSSVAEAIKQFGRLPHGLSLQQCLQEGEGFLRNVFRRDAVTALARSGVRMRVVGRGWDSISLPANVELDAVIDYEGIFRLAGRAKICLDASTYFDGVNDRAFNYALNGAVCFTNAAGYLRGGFGEQNGMRFYSMHRLAELGDQVKTLLSQPDVLREAGERARQTVLASHTWRHRVENMLNEMTR